MGYTLTGRRDEKVSAKSDLSPKAARYIGDLSRADAARLAELGAKYRRILEFGVGASTQIFAQATNAETEIICLDRETYWIDRTQALLDALSPGHCVRIIAFERLSILDSFANETFDLVFDDGDDDLRLEFALAAWRLLRPGGLLVFHDTRRSRDIGHAMAVVFRYCQEIGRIDINPDDTNIAIIHKTIARPKAQVTKSGISPS